MQQRQLRLGDILDDYCPRERRLTNHVVVAMIGSEVKQTRCTTCDADHEYKHARVPRPRKKGDEPAALYSQVLAGGPKRVVHEAPLRDAKPPVAAPDSVVGDDSQVSPVAAAASDADEGDTPGPEENDAEGPVHRPLIRATLPRHEGQVSPGRPAPDFTIRQPAGRPPNRFRGRFQHGGQAPQSNRPGGSMSGSGRSASQRQHGGRPPQGSITSRPSRRHDTGHKRSK